MAITKLKRGDQGRLKVDIGPSLKAGSVGIVVEVYEDHMTKHGSELFDIAVAFPWFRKEQPAINGAYYPKGLDPKNLHAGDVIPMRSDELEFVQNLLKDDASSE